MDRTTLLLAQWLSIAAAALFSFVMIQLVVDGTLENYLAVQKFGLLVLVGGVLLFLIVFLRVLALSFGGGERHHHDHHDGHEHGEHDHADHDHAPSLWRLILLALPLMLIFMGAPEGFSSQGIMNKLSTADIESLASLGAASLPEGFQMTKEPRAANWKEIVVAGNDPRLRDFWQSRPVQIVGQYGSDPRFDDRYRLMRVKITCCAADAVPLSVNVLGKPDPAWKDGQWIEVLGAVDFLEVPVGGRTDVFPVIYQLEVKPTSPQPWLQ